MPARVRVRATGVVHCVWGDAQWSRTQLLGEIARGHWGLCRAAVTDLPHDGGAARAARRWRPDVDGRLVFAPVTEMTEDFMRTAEQEMVALRARRAMGGGGGGGGGGGDDDDASEASEPPVSSVPGQ